MRWNDIFAGSVDGFADWSKQWIEIISKGFDSIWHTQLNIMKSNIYGLLKIEFSKHSNISMETITCAYITLFVQCRSIVHFRLCFWFSHFLFQIISDINKWAPNVSIYIVQCMRRTKTSIDGKRNIVIWYVRTRSHLVLTMKHENIKRIYQKWRECRCLRCTVLAKWMTPTERKRWKDILLH